MIRRLRLCNQITQTSRAGLITNLPPFDLGLGLTVRPAVTTGGGVPAPTADRDGELQPSLDVTQRLGANFLASLTFNTVGFAFSSNRSPLRKQVGHRADP